MKALLKNYESRSIFYKIAVTYMVFLIVSVLLVDRRCHLRTFEWHVPCCNNYVEVKLIVVQFVLSHNLISKILYVLSFRARCH